MASSCVSPEPGRQRDADQPDGLPQRQKLAAVYRGAVGASVQRPGEHHGHPLTVPGAEEE